LRFLGWGKDRPLSGPVRQCLLQGGPGLPTRLSGLLAERLHCQPDRIHWVSQARQGIGLILESLKLGPGDEVLATDHEYPDCRRQWLQSASRRGFSYREVTVGLPVTSHAQLADDLWSAVRPRTRVVYFSHITCLTALLLPFQELCRRARQAGVVTVVDGAHAPGQVEFSLDKADPDFYCGCLHKWLGAPSHTAFVYARDAWPAPPLSPDPAWPAAEVALQSSTCLESAYQLAQQAREQLSRLTGLEPLQPAGPAWTAAMVAVALPWLQDPLQLQDQLASQGYQVNVHHFGQRTLLRICFGPEDRPEHLQGLLQQLELQLQVERRLSPSHHEAFRQ